MKKILLLFSIILSSVFNIYCEQPVKGYRGFVEWANDVNPDINIYGGPTNTKYYTGVAISQGYQFNSSLYLGGGIMVEQCMNKGNIDEDNKMFSAPFFADIRTDLKFGKFTPFADLRMGYNFSNYGGIYFSPIIGYRISIYSKIGINIGIGYSLTGNRNIIEIITEESWGTIGTYQRRTYYTNCLTFRIGFDF